MAPLTHPDPPPADARILLRPPAEEDVPWIARAARDPLVPRYTTVPEHTTEQLVRAWLMTQDALRQRGEALTFLAVERATGERIGPMGLHRVDARQRSAEIGYWTARAARGRGLTEAAARLLCAHAFGPLGLERLQLLVHEDNRASLRIGERCGFTREGLLRGAERRASGRRSLVVYGLLAGELTSAR